MKRILVTGNSGSGKSTVARELGAILGLPVIHLDRLYWNPGWVPTPDDVFVEKVRAATEGETWVIDGNYGATFEARLARADVLVFLDLPRWLCVWRILTRRTKDRPEWPDDCPEHRFTRDYVEFVRYTLDFPNRRRPMILEAMQREWDRKTIVHLRSRAAVARFLDGLRRARSAPR